MQYLMARNIEKVLGLDSAPPPTALRINAFLNSMWDAAVNEKHGTNWPNERGVGEHGVVVVSTDDIREFAMSQVGAAKQSMELALKNPKLTMATLVEMMEGGALDLTAADYIMSKMEGRGSSEQFLIYANKVDLP